MSDFNHLCDIDVLGVEENHLSHGENVYKKFKQQPERNGRGWYETGPIWTENKVPLKYLEAYDQVIRDQLVNNLI